MREPADLPVPSTEPLRLMLGVRLGLLAVAERLRQNWAAHAAAAGLSTAQVNALLTLQPGEAVPMRSLAARLDYDASNLSVLIDRLERRGAVERAPIRPTGGCGRWPSRRKANGCGPSSGAG
jgi:hypothetical protein